MTRQNQGRTEEHTELELKLGGAAIQCPKLLKVAVAVDPRQAQCGRQQNEDDEG